MSELLNYEELKAMEKSLLGDSNSVSKEETPQWKTISPDNLLVRNLKQVLGIYAQAVKKGVEEVEKNLKVTRKMFHG